MSQEANAPQVPLIVQYQHQLESFKQQKEQAKIHLEQLNGAIFACEQMILQYEHNLKQGAEMLAKEVAAKANPIENLGENNDGEAQCEKKE